MPAFLGYTCTLCARQYLPHQATYTCACGGNLDVSLDIEQIRRGGFTPTDSASLWRYQPLLPVALPPGAERTPLSLPGGTPILSLARSAWRLGLHTLWLKDESRNPTASFKDRASAIVVARAREIGAQVIVTASTGNAGAALAGMSAAIGQKSVIFAPKNAPPAKIAQLLIFGARVLLVEGTYDDAFDLSLQAAAEFGWYCRNTGYNPFTLEGKKTAAFEIWETLLQDEIAPPLTIFVSVGDGNIISGLHKGFKDLLALGWLAPERLPRLVGVQAEGSAAIFNAFHAGGETITPVRAATLADSISVDLPRDGIRALRAARETAGTYITVSDEQILAAIAALGREGIFSEPAGAAAYAGVCAMQAAGRLNLAESVLVLNTGNGLKDVRAASQATSPAPIIEPTLAALKRAIQSTKKQDLP